MSESFSREKELEELNDNIFGTLADEAEMMMDTITEEESEEILTQGQEEYYFEAEQINRKWTEIEFWDSITPFVDV